MKKEMKALLLETYKGDEIIEYIELLERENKALDEEGVAKCELNKLLEKALDKACEELENLSYVKGLGQVGKNFKEWKEWCMKDVD